MSDDKTAKADEARIPKIDLEVDKNGFPIFDPEVFEKLFEIDSEQESRPKKDFGDMHRMIEKIVALLEADKKEQALVLVNQFLQDNFHLESYLQFLSRQIVLLEQSMVSIRMLLTSNFKDQDYSNHIENAKRSMGWILRSFEFLQRRGIINVL